MASNSRCEAATGVVALALEKEASQRLHRGGQQNLSAQNTILVNYAEFVDVATLNVKEMTYGNKFMNDLILQPILFMGMLSLVMMLLMYATRIPAAKVLEAEGVDLQKLSHPAQLGGVFPSKVERFADNYNHLWEQPTLFYAVVLVIWALRSYRRAAPLRGVGLLRAEVAALDCAGHHQSRLGAL